MTFYFFFIYDNTMSNSYECKRYKDCKSIKEVGCEGCGYKHFEKILEGNKNNDILVDLSKKFFEL